MRNHDSKYHFLHEEPQTIENSVGDILGKRRIYGTGERYRSDSCAITLRRCATRSITTWISSP